MERYRLSVKPLILVIVLIVFWSQVCLAFFRLLRGGDGGVEPTSTPALVSVLRQHKRGCRVVESNRYWSVIVCGPTPSPSPFPTPTVWWR